MHIGYYLADQHPWKDKSIGISNYTHDLINHLAAFDLRISTLVSKSSIKFGTSVNDTTLPWSTESSTGRLIADNLHCWWPWDKTIDLIHYPKGFIPISKYKKKPIITTIHDVILDYYQDRYPESRSCAAWTYWTHQLKRAIRCSDAIITISETSKKQIQEFSVKHCLTPPPIHVTYEGSRFEIHHSNSKPTNTKLNQFVLFSSVQPHKGTAKLLLLWEKWLKTQSDPPLLQVIGDLPTESAHMVGRNPLINKLPYQSEDNLIKVIRSSRGLIVPSEIEGFGLPVLESFYLGTPAIVIKNTSCHEILDFNNKAGFDIECAESFNESMDWILRLSGSEILDISELLYSRFNWNLVAQHTIDVYHSVLKT